jgi:calcium-dependent protein kinase
MENNKTGSKIRLELLSKKEEQSIKYIYWLKSNQLVIKCFIKGSQKYSKKFGGTLR